LGIEALFGAPGRVRELAAFFVAAVSSLTSFPIYLILGRFMCIMYPAWVSKTLRAAALVILLTLAAAPSTATASLGAQLGHALSRAGSLSGAYVYDLSARTTLYSLRADVSRPPASVEKLYTAATALELMGPQATLTTTVLGSGHMGFAGLWEGSLYLRGGGDPTFGSASFIASHYGTGASVTALAAALVKAGVRGVTGSVYGDDSYFDSLRGEPASGYAPDPDLEGQLGALSFDRGESGPEQGAHALAAYAARRLRAALRADGVTVHSGGAASAPPGATPLASVSSPTVARLLALTLPASDNFFAETLLKDLGARFGGAGSTSAGAAVVRATVARLGIHPRSLLDGSGLSHADLTTPHEVVALLTRLAHSPLGTTLRADLAVAGHTGTLSDRMRHSAARGRCQAKTGTLIGVSNLAGYCSARNGHILAFAFFMDGIETYRAHALQDALADALARY
jgi:serine-type D-Ala-D-Ala carboxypeptidase/endopeptidase (penicillin-binding protein 4)